MLQSALPILSIASAVNIFMLGFGATKLIYDGFSLFRILEQCYLGAVFLSLPFVLVWLISFCSVTIQLVLLAIALAFLPLFIVFRVQ